MRVWHRRSAQVCSSPCWGPSPPAAPSASVVRPMVGAVTSRCAPTSRRRIEDVYAVVAEFGRYGGGSRRCTLRSEGRPPSTRCSFACRGRSSTCAGASWSARSAALRRSSSTWRQLDGDFARNEGTWTLRSAGPNRTVVRYDNVVQFRRWVPGWLIARAERRVAPQMIAAIQQRAIDHARARALAARAAR